MFNKRVLILLFLLIVSVGTISSVSAGDLSEDIVSDANFDKMEVEGENVIGIDENDNEMELLSEINLKSDDSSNGADDILSVSEDEILQDNTNGRHISQLQNLIQKASSGGTITLNFDYYCTEDTDMAGIVINKPITINGNGHTIDANGYSRIFYIASDKVVINDLTFKNGYYYDINVYFLGHGGAVYIEEGTTTFNNCNFYNNVVEYNGGAICSGAGLVINKCTFSNNVAKGMDNSNTGSVFGFGGAIYAFSSVTGNKQIKITDSTFKNNNARAGGALYIDYSTQDFNNHGVPDALKTYLKNCEFTSNYALYGGGAIYNCRDLDVSGCKFNKNTADGSGGAICLENGNGIKDYYFCVIPVNLEVHGNTVFSNNKAKYSGGAILYSYMDYGINSPYGNDRGMIRIYDNTRFESNSATNNGGALSITNIESIVQGATFLNNVAGTGGAMYGSTAIDCTFTGNSNPQTYDTVIMSNAVLTVSQSGTTCDNKVITATLKDGNGELIADEYVSFNINGKISKVKTNQNGQATLKANLPAKTYPATIAYDGVYGSTSKQVSVVVKKATPKLTASAKSYKVKESTKKYTVTLKNSKNAAIKKTKVTISVKGKTFSATTDSSGKATFKINNLKTKGSFKATVKFAGNTYYNKVTKSVTITAK